MVCVIFALCFWLFIVFSFAYCVTWYKGRSKQFTPKIMPKQQHNKIDDVIPNLSYAHKIMNSNSLFGNSNNSIHAQLKHNHKLSIKKHNQSLFPYTGETCALARAMSTFIKCINCSPVQSHTRTFTYRT